MGLTRLIKDKQTTKQMKVAKSQAQQTKGEVEFQKFVRYSYHRGIIESISIQGDLVFAIIRRAPGKFLTNDEKDAQEESKEDNSYFGSQKGVHDKDLTLTELLIQTDINLSLIQTNPAKFIGSRVVVWQVGQKPLKAFLHAPLLSSRLMDLDHLVDARMLSKKQRKHNPSTKKYEMEGYPSITRAGYDYLIRQGYTEKQIKSTFEERVVGKGSIITYGTKDWQDKQSTNSNVELKDSVEGGIVSHIVKGKKDEKELCYKPIKAFLAL